jgi:hypothetical protein
LPIDPAIPQLSRNALSPKVGIRYRTQAAGPHYELPTAIPLPADLDVMQAAMLRINPATALCLLEDHVGLRLGDWVIQNATNSAVGGEAGGRIGDCLADGGGRGPFASDAAVPEELEGRAHPKRK